MSQNIVKKLSVKTVHGKVDPSKLDKEGSVLFRIMGEASGLKSGESQFGAWTALTGQFAAIKPSGEMVRASQAFLPDVLLSMIQPVVEQGEKVEFVFDVVAVPDSSVAVGYTYAARPVIAPEPATDPIARLMEKAGASPALAAPTPAPKKAAKK